MENTCQVLVALIERLRRCRVTKLVITSVQDYNAKIWLVNTSECTVVVSGDENKRYDRLLLVLCFMLFNLVYVRVKDSQGQKCRGRGLLCVFTICRMGSILHYSYV